ncbi:MAG TPA: Stp1/IreP family PP2C-type Ser/Thr phosphatase [Polyangiaceae bacterium]|nr:Stp1/IreP family PP2C-type Ser/Thr phosphatase [Polyangiaceae bacterium]
MGEVAAGKKKSGAIEVRVFGQTDVGQVREHNEDNFLVADLTRKSREFAAGEAHVLGKSGAVFGVCDGMGGAAAGEVASRLAVDMIYDRLVEAKAPKNREDLARRLVRAVQDAGVRIFSEARADRSRRGMGTTSTIATLVDERLFLAQVGDSRAYILRDGELTQVTRDQSLVNQLIEAGQLTEEEAETFEHNNIILQALGTSEVVQVDLTYVDLRADDTLLICSDGLSGMVRGEDIRGVLTELEEPSEACARLVALANEAGGHDNVTVVIVKFGGAGLSEAGPEDDAVSYRKYALAAGEGGPGEEAAPSERSAFRDTAKLPLSRNDLAAKEDSPDDKEPISARPALLAKASSSPPSEEVVVHMEGLPPRTVGAIIMAGVTLIIVMGFYLLR